MAQPTGMPFVIRPGRLFAGLRANDDPAPLAGGAWWVADDPGAGLACEFPPGTLADAKWLTCDLFLEGLSIAQWVLELQEGAEGPCFELHFGALGNCPARMRLPTDMVTQNRWGYPREGAFLKPLCTRDPVYLAKVDRLRLRLERKAPGSARWCMTPLTFTDAEPAPLDDAVPEGLKLLDEFGQSATRQWAGRTKSPDELVARLRSQLEQAPSQTWPAEWSRWGGWKERAFEATGFFRTQHDGQRWWLVDPEGHPFWSAGCDCVRQNIQAVYAGIEDAMTWLPDADSEYAGLFGPHPGSARARGAFNYLGANFIRAFGAEEWEAKWATTALAHLRRFGFNTVGNWSDWRYAAAAGFPYVRPLSVSFPRTKPIFRDLPDIFDPSFEQDVADYASELQETRDDPAMIGYFLMNEPQWGFAWQTPAEGMLRNTPRCATRRALADWLSQRYESDEALADAWGSGASLDLVREGAWSGTFGSRAQGDLEEFSEIMIDRFFEILTDACRKVDPNHLNLGARYYKLPPKWALRGMRRFDVFSVNCYRERVPPDWDIASLNLPVLVGEWHFGALDAGLPATGIGHVKDQADRGRAYRVYLENAAAMPWCVGVHWFTLYDQSAIGRYDGECYNIGFLDVCNRPYDELALAARVSHERLYRVAAGDAKAFDDAPEYLPMLCV
jgi:hypothetical protein